MIETGKRRERERVYMLSKKKKERGKKFWHTNNNTKQNKKMTEKPRPKVNTRMRVILLDWLIDVHRKFKLLPPTLYLCTNLLDRYLSEVQVPKSKLQLVGCACLWLASKYHEIYAPEIRDFVFVRCYRKKEKSTNLKKKQTNKKFLDDDAFAKEELVKQESAIVDQLKFQLTLPTPLAFAERFLKIGNCGVGLAQNQKIIRCLVFYLLEHGLMKYELARSLPSKLAAACLAYSLLATNSYTSWVCFFARHAFLLCCF
ncbi:cyclin [Reticulomyxa filosa]|uniref:Cyclin n=1 Tax=Reticulomyxa filosa TaxID=46433 RepID=X6N315_RETFI|nr:cyclin [Reticulomyxa filosa]|eukprot:ETO19707.1 cyclin [Reticulomyxa filosa]